MTDEWDSFDQWCLLRGIEPLELSGRRLVNLVQTFIENAVALSEKATEAVQHALRQADDVLHPILEHYAPPKRKLTHGDVAPFQRRKLADVEPPSWFKNEKQNWAGVQAFMGSNKGVSRG